jgi:META domain-containing protein
VKSLVALVAFLCAAGTAQAAADPDDLFRRDWVSTAVLKDGKPHPRFDETKVRVDFVHYSDYDFVSWRADCNSLGASVYASKERLFTGQVSGNDIKCVVRHWTRKERWLNRFFGADPRWRIRTDGTLKLRAGDRVITLRRRAAGSAHAVSDPGDLFGRGWVSTAVLKGGEEHSLFDGTKLRVDFNRRDDYDAVAWQANCNSFGADVHATKRRLFTGQVYGTDEGCAKVLHRQDRWMTRFFGSDPRWRIRRGGTLKLTENDRVIKLRRRGPRG